MRTEDGYIIDKCLNGDAAAFGLLVDKYRESIYALAYFKLRNFHDAEDITQEVFLKAYQKLSTLRRWDNFLAWLYAITSNLCKDFIRKQAKRLDREFIAEQDKVILNLRSINSYREELAYESLHEALGLLPEVYQQVLTLYYLGRMNSEEIAKFLGKPVGTIRKQLSRARGKLKKEMLDMMSKTYDQQKLPLGFTFRIVEIVKHIKIQPAPRSTPLLPLGLSAATGIVLTALMFSPHLISLTPLGALLGSPMPSETKVMAVGELPVDVLDISEITFLSSEQGDDDGEVAKLPNPKNAFAPPLAPSGKDKWTKRTDMLTTRAFLTASTVNGKIYAIGGGVGGPAFSTVEEYDPATNIWTKKANMPGAKQSLSSSVVNGKIYTIGGWNGGILSTVEEYDPAIDKWTKKADMPTARSELSTSVVNGKIYAIGGGVGPDAVLSAVEEYDPATDKWTKKTDMPTARSVLITCAVEGKIYAIGGMDANTAFSTVEVYEPATDTWTKRADMPTARVGLSASTVNGKIYVIGGATAWGVFTSVVEEYDTGFAGQGIDTEGKLPTTWGHMKTEK